MEAMNGLPTLEVIDCIFCSGDASSDVLIRENGFEGRQCRGCGLIFVSPRPSLADIIDLYGHDEAQVPAQAHLTAGIAKRLYARHTLRILGRHRSSGDLLEIGAGGGSFLDEARRAGFSPFAIEFNGTQARHIREHLGIPCEGKALAEQPFPGRKFDVIYHCDVVSHFHDPVAEFSSFHEALQDGGLVVFETGNLGDVDHHHLKAFDRFQYPDHLFFYSSRNIEQLLVSTGFELLAMHRYSIVADLLVGKVRTRFRKLVRAVRAGSAPEGRASQQEKSLQPQAPLTNSTDWGFGALAKAIDQYLNYFIRYHLGSLLPKGRRPQSIIVVARKLPDTPR